MGAYAGMAFNFGMVSLPDLSKLGLLTMMALKEGKSGIVDEALNCEGLSTDMFTGHSYDTPFLLVDTDNLVFTNNRSSWVRTTLVRRAGYKNMWIDHIKKLYQIGDIYTPDKDQVIAVMISECPTGYALTRLTLFNDGFLAIETHPLPQPYLSFMHKTFDIMKDETLWDPKASMR